MKKVFNALGICVAVAVSPHNALGAEAVSGSPTIVFRSVWNQAPAGGVELANGVKVLPKDWRTLFSARLKDDKDNRSTCTATLVGPGVFLTAAHCFDKGPGLALLTSAILDVGGQSITASCSVSAEYQNAVNSGLWEDMLPRVSEDYALCHFDLPAIVPADLSNLLFENMDVDTTVPEKDPALMTGFGCAKISIDPKKGVQATDFDHQLRIGDATIAVTAKEGATGAGAFVRIWSTTNTQPALCPGDSGGPLLSGATTFKQDAPRRVIGINSFVSMEQPNPKVIRIVSNVAPLASGAFRRFVSDWLRDRPNLMICGVNGVIGEPPCRD